MFNTANNQDIVQTKLDKLFFQESRSSADGSRPSGRMISRGETE